MSPPRCARRYQAGRWRSSTGLNRPSWICIKCAASTPNIDSDRWAFPIELDEGFAMAHGCLAYWYQQRARPEDSKKTVIKALALTPGVTRRERQQIEVIGYWINGRGRNSIALIKEHLSESLRDGSLLRKWYYPAGSGCSDWAADKMAI